MGEGEFGEVLCRLNFNTLPLTPEEYQETVVRVIEAQNISSKDYDITMSIKLCFILKQASMFSFVYWNEHKYSGNWMTIIPHYDGKFCGFRVVVDDGSGDGIWFKFTEREFDDAVYYA